MENNYTLPFGINLILSMLCGLIANALGYIIILKDMYGHTFWDYPGIISLSLFCFVNMAIIALFTFVNQKTSDGTDHFMLYNISFTIPSLIISIVRYVMASLKVNQANIQDNCSSRSSNEQLIIDNLHRSEIYLLQVFTMLLLVVIFSVILKKYRRKSLFILFGSFVGYCSILLVFIAFSISGSIIINVFAVLIVTYVAGLTIVLFCKHIDKDADTENTGYCSKIILITINIINIGILALFLIEYICDPSEHATMGYYVAFIYITIYTLQQFIAYRVVKHELK